MDNRADWRVLASRPAEQNGPWRQKLETAGCEVLEIPLLEIVELVDNPSVQQIKNRIINLDLYDGVIFVSQNAVAVAFNWIEDYWPQLPSHVCFYAVGKKTADLIRQRVEHIEGRPGQVIHHAEGAMDSEALLAQLMQPEQPVRARATEKGTTGNDGAECGVAGKKYLICRGKGGRPVIRDQLSRAGAVVDYCELYERKLPSVAAEHFSKTVFDPSRDIASVFSGETLDNLIAVYERAHVPVWRDIPVLVPGKRVADKAGDAGFKHIVVAENATEEAMLDALKKFIGKTI